MKYFFTISLILGYLIPTISQTGCPNCNINLPNLPADTIFLTDAVAGEVAVYYDEDISFRMPRTTTPVNVLDPNTPAGIDINDITIVAVANLPPGLNWEPNMTNFDTDNGETDGCVKICGTPLISGFFEVEVVVEASVSVLNQSASFSFPMNIIPATSNNAGFSMTNNSGCGEVVVSFNNNNPSNGAAGFSYFWDFGNGNSTLAENPIEQTYSTPGIYEVDYSVIIDTAGFVLTSLSILDDDCADLIGGADLYIKIKDPNNNTIFESEVINNTPIPFTFNLNIPLPDAGAYKLEVRDEDPFGDENCGDIFFTQSNNDTLSSGGLTVAFNIFHPVFEFTTTDTVVVYEQPNNPIISPSEPMIICNGQIIDLMADYDNNLQWFRDTVLLFGETNPILEVSESGNYLVQYTSTDGCQAISTPVNVDVLAAPALPIFSNNNNLLSVNNEDNLPVNYELQWYLSGVALQFANDPIYCMQESGEYTLIVTDLDTGCSSQYMFAHAYDPEFDCSALSTNDIASEISLGIYPNPSNGQFWISADLSNFDMITLEVYDLTGRVIYKHQQNAINFEMHQIDLMNQAKGLYLARIILDDQTVVTKKVFVE